MSTVPAAAQHRLATARLYLCTDSRAERGDLRDFVRACFAGGVDIIQIREKGIEAAQELAALAIVAEEAHQAGALVSANDRADVATLAGVDVLHVGQDDLRPEQVRRLAPEVAVGLSTHDEQQLVAAIEHPEVDYFCVGPVWPTPTKPGRPGVGLDLIRRAAESTTDKPWFAIGGISHETIEQVVEAGATRVVVVRDLTEADDPEEAARRLRSFLPR
ncbi:MAG: thiamine phosphate synthase [Mobilicoccus sp.]|nr:thiamine phosphate synthase [Mobilicoccus sp.]